jgi:hypothetical protein
MIQPKTAFSDNKMDRVDLQFHLYKNVTSTSSTVILFRNLCSPSDLAAAVVLPDLLYKIKTINSFKQTLHV